MHVLLCLFRGDAWHRLRQEDFSQVNIDDSPELMHVIKEMMRTEPSLRMSAHAICSHPIVSRARMIMEKTYVAAKTFGTNMFAVSPLAGVEEGFLDEILGRRISENGSMDF